MAIIHGQAIAAEEIERIVGREFSAETFARLSNAVAWGHSWQGVPSLPAFTERVYVGDKGIDAEWEIHLPEGADQPSGFIGPGWNIFQYKKRDVTQHRGRTISALKCEMKGTIQNLVKAKRRRPDIYVLYCNIHLKEGDHSKFKAAILHGYSEPENVRVEVVGAAELATFLNNLPHLRSAFFVTYAYQSWAAEWDAHQRERQFASQVELIGRETEFKTVRAWVDDPDVRAIVISGPHMMGKTRLVLEAVRHRDVDVVIALDPRSLTLDDLFKLETRSRETVVIIDNPEPDKAQQLLERVLTQDRFKLVITLPTAENVPIVNFGQDARIKKTNLERLSEKESEELLEAAGTKLDFSLQSWVLEKAGGVPGILLMAAGIPDLRKEAGDFVVQVARAFEERAKRILDTEAVKSLGLISLLTHLGVEGEAQKEAELACDLFGGGLNLNGIKRAIPSLADAGLVRPAGSYVEALPPLLANYLAAQGLMGRTSELEHFFMKLENPARSRLLRRLIELKTAEVDQFFDRFFIKDGLFGNLRRIFQNAGAFRLIAGAVSEKASQKLFEGLGTTTFEERLSITGDTRRELIWALEELLFRKRSSEAALRCLALLAEAETEKYANNATGIFCEAMAPLHPQMPLPLNRRLAVLKWVSEKDSSASCLLAIKGAQEVLKGHSVVSLRPSSGVEPLGTRPQMTYGECWNYLESLVDIIEEACDSPDPEVSAAANHALPGAIENFTLECPPERGIRRLEALVEKTLEGEPGKKVAQVAASLQSVQKGLKDRLEKAPEDDSESVRLYVEQVDGLLRRLEQADFPLRLKRWAGAQDWEYIRTESGEIINRSDIELEKLAAEAINNPAILTPELLDWLCSSGAQSAESFFWFLGKLDESGIFQEKIEELGSRDDEAVVFSSYFRGWGQRDAEAARCRLAELVDLDRLTPRANLYTTHALGGDASAVKRIIELLRQGSVESSLVAKTLSVGRWIEPLKPEDFLGLLQAIARPDFEHGVAAIKLLGMWAYLGKAIEGNLAHFAWQCLEAVPSTVEDTDAYYCDKMAAKLAPTNIDRSFELLRSLLARNYSINTWNPIGRHRRSEFWGVLRKHDRERALRTIFEIASEDPEKRIRICWDLPELLDLEKDADFIIAFALESEQNALLVCEAISRPSPAFWHIALKIVETYPESQEIKSGLMHGILMFGQGVWVEGPWSFHLQRCKEEIEEILGQQDIPAVARQWLEEVSKSIQQQIKRELKAEADMKVNR